LWELWGDDDNTTERRTVAVKIPPATNGYMSPYQVGGVLYEENTFPAGTAGQTTNFRRVCRDCHQGTPPPGLTNITWGTNKHGGAPTSSLTTYGGLKAPYNTVTQPTNYNLNCTDCHEPHGSRNEYLLRWAVNGVTNIQIANSLGTYQTRRWYNFCIACHTYISTIGPHNPISQGVAAPQDMDCNWGGGCHAHGNAGAGLF
jgi:predicted CXXCH cytochrome family protein